MQQRKVAKEAFKVYTEKGPFWVARFCPSQFGSLTELYCRNIQGYFSRLLLQFWSWKDKELALLCHTGVDFCEKVTFSLRLKHVEYWNKGNWLMNLLRHIILSSFCSLTVKYSGQFFSSFIVVFIVKICEKFKEGVWLIFWKSIIYQNMNIAWN